MVRLVIMMIDIWVWGLRLGDWNLIIENLGLGFELDTRIGEED